MAEPNWSDISRRVARDMPCVPEIETPGIKAANHAAVAHMVLVRRRGDETFRLVSGVASGDQQVELMRDRLPCEVGMRVGVGGRLRLGRQWSRLNSVINDRDRRTTGANGARHGLVDRSGDGRL